MPLSYQQAGLVLKRPGEGASDAQIRDLQRHLRALGYLRQGISTGLSGAAPKAPSRACSTTSCTTTAAAGTARRRSACAITTTDASPR